jgi:hypothetical protein
MDTASTISPDAPLNYLTQARAEKAAIDRFREPGNQWGGEDCKRILRAWFPRLLERVQRRRGTYATAGDYEEEIDDVVWILEWLRNAFSANIDRTLCDTVQEAIWIWPSEKQLLFPPDTWRRRSNSPADTENLKKYLSEYVERPWLQHNVIDGAAINALLFSALSHAMDLYRMGAFGPTDWVHFLWKSGSRMRPFWRHLAGLCIGKIVIPFLKWLLLPTIAAVLMWTQYDMPAEVIFGVWIVFLLFSLGTLKRGRSQKKDADRSVGAMRLAWQCSCAEVINPSRLRELVVDAEHKGAIDYPTVLHTLIDRAILRDPTALHTRKMPSP